MSSVNSGYAEGSSKKVLSRIGLGVRGFFESGTMLEGYARGSREWVLFEGGASPRWGGVYDGASASPLSERLIGNTRLLVVNTIISKL